MRGPREPGGELPGNEEAHDGHPAVETDVVDRGEEHEEEGGDEAADHADDEEVVGQDERGEEGAGKTTKTHAGAVESVRQGCPEILKMMTEEKEVLTDWVGSSWSGPHIPKVVDMDWKTLTTPPDREKKRMTRLRNILLPACVSLMGPLSLCLVLVFSS